MLPFHFVKKTVKIFVDNETTERELWKGEKFIFDILDYCKAGVDLPLKINLNSANSKSFEDKFSGMNVICFEKSRCYSPLKNFSGRDSIEDVQEALYQKDRRVFSEITGKDPSNKMFELSLDFHYPSDETIKKWRGCDLPQSSYVES